MTTTSVAIGIVLGVALFLHFRRKNSAIWAIRFYFMRKIIGESSGLGADLFGGIFEVKPRARRRNVPLVSRAPGWGLRRFADLCFSKKAFTQVLEPTLTDMQKEHFEALAANRPWQARMVLVRGYFSFWSAVAAQLPISLARRVYEVWKATKTGS
jgi:hypothetical protein